MLKLSTAAYQLACVLGQISRVKDDTWDLPFEEFTAIEKSESSEYWLKGKYGPGPDGYPGAQYLSKYLYIYLEVGGAEITDDSVVTTWASLTNPDFTQ